MTPPRTRTCEQVVIRFKAKALCMSDTPKDADRQLRANPAEYQRRSGPLGELEGVTTEETQAYEGDEVRGQANKFKGETEKRKEEEGGTGEELGKFICKISRIKPFVISYPAGGKSVVRLCWLDSLKQNSLSLFHITHGKLDSNSVPSGQMMTWNHFIL